MGVFDTIPEELLTRIFTIGAENDVHSCLIQCTVPRRMKPLIAKASLVCRRWSEVASFSSNFHFWVTVLSLRGWSVNFDLEQQAYAFEKALLDSQDSDIFLDVTVDHT